MLSLFSDMVEHFLEIFMDDFSIYGDAFDQCLHHLELVLQRCKEKNLTLNWEKCHFIVRQGIVLGHEISRRGIEVDKAKVEVIAKLPPPKSIKDIRSFLGHVGFHRRFIKDFNKIARPLTNLLAKDVPFDFNNVSSHGRSLSKNLFLRLLFLPLIGPNHSKSCAMPLILLLALF